MSVLSDFAASFTNALLQGEHEKQTGAWVYEGSGPPPDMQSVIVPLRLGEKLEYIQPIPSTAIYCDYCGSKVTKPNCTQCGAPTRRR